MALVRHRVAFAGLVILLGLIVMAAFAPVLAPYDPNEQDLYQVLQGPSRQHLLGTDDVGRDLLSRVIYGSRVTLAMGILSTLFAAVIGILAGLVAGYKGGIWDAVIMRITDTFMCMPALVLALVIVAALGPGMKSVVISITVLAWTGFARITRGQVMIVRELPYVEAAHALGASGYRIMFRHLLPNVMAPLIVTATISVGMNIMLESAVSFLGIGVQQPTPSWGNELRIGYSYLEIVPLFSIAPGLMITLAVLAFNFLGDGLRDALDPRLRGEEKAGS
ncbi:MAG TPA: ABC transporter permease [Deltaproteobacteria bacterium]|nr:ABC transporter permease [Deltaproteobacteria bacterium]HOM29456.1 ABC transporter permease [Deltaproteobacteria bacterium]